MVEAAATHFSRYSRWQKGIHSWRGPDHDHDDDHDDDGDDCDE